MSLEDFFKRLNLDESLAERTGFNPYYLRMTSGLEGEVSVNGRELIDLASNNYLGLADDSRVKRAAMNAIRDYGTSLCGTPIATGCLDMYQELAEKLSAFVGLEQTSIFPSCYQANNGLFACLAGPEDLILVDRLAHSSLLQGIKSSGCKIRPFLHNDLDHLERCLQRGIEYRQVFVVTESVFSTEGSIASVKEIVHLCDKYQALPVIDDSHGIGVLGKYGKGILEEQGISDYQGIYTASLGKALANSGGMISGSKKLMDYLKYYCSHLVYSTALPPAALAGTGAVLEIINSEFPGIKKTMDSYQRQIYQALLAAGFKAADSATPINSIQTGSKENTFALAKAFFDQGILITPFIEPSVPFNEGRVRLIAGANLSQDSIKKVLDTIKRLGPL
ncbi:7-keto-8-aminopelargonate synthetase-like enzyme [Desulfosporosinus orientis DSM 765]|uniref:7-keto-8-aminopelargonate synthetase-like enzyme n=1 Tax=Desulfosporosinus orientis (strain ATCC 19365 / DSM 765 / NCIMB 8382 / VKM B-1628 / Singapore I) TaxID=768706 RepID=G7WF61_DESOD|nr:pyridoxal phosphate-dependent aminotransferase family protein [Desulfosporosinus orientis]AET67672.1 7-keto-8-aminopelargonate synthetase-like enzyme [Desulfosporosinus orientis DSM 765]